MSENRYHHGDLRQAILVAACHHLRHGNADSLSLRALAREIGVSQTAPYRHFDSKNALYAGIATWGFSILEKELAQIATTHLPPVDSVVALGVAYLKFSEEHTEKYQLFFDNSLVDFDEYADLQESSARCFNHLLEVIRKGKESGLYQDRADEDLAGLIWASLHGMASLLQLNRQQATFTERPVGQAVRFLAEEREVALRLLLRSILE